MGSVNPCFKHLAGHTEVVPNGYRQEVVVHEGAFPDQLLPDLCSHAPAPVSAGSPNVLWDSSERVSV